MQVARSGGWAVVVILGLIGPFTLPTSDAQHTNIDIPEMEDIRDTVGVAYTAYPIGFVPTSVPGVGEIDIQTALLETFPEYKALWYLLCPSVPSPYASADVPFPKDRGPYHIYVSIVDDLYDYPYLRFCVYDDGKYISVSGAGVSSARAYAGTTFDQIQIWIPTYWPFYDDRSLASVGSYDIVLSSS